MDLIDIQRRCIDRMLRLLLPEGGIGPVKALDVVELAGGGGPGLRVEAVGIRLLADLAVRPRTANL